MKLEAYPFSDPPVEIRAATPRRDWMDRSTRRFAYRCLPLTIANTHGWELLCPRSFEALWLGGPGSEAVQVVPLDDVPGDLPDGQFGEGVLTFSTGHLFRTAPGVNLCVGGPPNTRKHGIVPLGGIIESDWLPFPFTMNWGFTRPGLPVRFERGEPFCHIFPIHRGLIDSTVPERCELTSNPELHAELVAWAKSRNDFNAELRMPGTIAHAQGWQRFYIRGNTALGTPGSDEHQTRVHVEPFVNASGVASAACPVAGSGTTADVSEGADAAGSVGGGADKAFGNQLLWAPDLVMRRIEAGAVYALSPATGKLLKLARPVYDLLRQFEQPKSRALVVAATPQPEQTERFLEVLVQHRCLIPFVLPSEAAGGQA